MRKILVIVSLGLVLAYHAGASLITFDDLASDTVNPIASPYAGLNWNNFYVYAGGSDPNSGYAPAVVSQNNVAFNGFGASATISDGTFDLDSAYLTAAWNDNLQVEVIGMLGATILYDNTYTLSATAPTLVNFNYLGIDSVQFISSGGTPHGGYDGTGTQFAMDNLTVNENAAVPEPTTVIAGAMLLLPFGLNTVRLLRKQRAA
jgi:hypothetical protein